MRSSWRLPRMSGKIRTGIAQLPVEVPFTRNGQPSVRIPLSQLATINPHLPGSFVYLSRK